VSATHSADEEVAVADLVVDYGKTRAVDGVSFNVAAGELVTLLGPSGCGKTTTLRAIAGLEHVSGGTITLAGTIVSDAAARRFVPTERRNIGMVFQSYALWPFMTVADAVAYPLRRRRVPKDERADRVMKMLAIVGMEAFAQRRVPELSGGQQQRVAIARALVYEPRLLLLDEPLSNLDARLRDRLRFEIQEIQSRLRITTICVTHDQAEALAMSHRVIVMQSGRIEQVGAPEEIYTRPLTRFAGEAVGKVNVLDGRVVHRAGDVLRVELDGVAGVFGAWSAHATAGPGDAVVLIVRPEKIVIAAAGRAAAAGNVLEGVIEVAIFGGDHREYTVRVGTQRITVKADALIVFAIGARVELHLLPEHLTVVSG
jgi:iron(III) transport system ATP-binding protein